MCVCTCACTDQYTKRTSIVCTCITIPHLMINVVNLTRLQILILGAFVMISSGVILYLYSNVITFVRFTPATQTANIQRILESQHLEGTLSTIHTVFAGMILEILFLVSLRCRYVCTYWVHARTCICTLPVDT